jgi:hypothetical protein
MQHTEEPHLEKWPHEYGIEYCWLVGDHVLGTVTPVAPQVSAKEPKRWRAAAGGRLIGVFTGKCGRMEASRAVLHFIGTSRQVPMEARYERSA